MSQTKRSEVKKERRSFLNTLLKTGLVAWVASVIYPVARFLIPPKMAKLNVSSIEVGLISDFPKSSSKIVRFGRKPIIVIRKESGDFKALEATCTHLDCNVQFKSETEQIWCACHNGLYDIEGKNISGPPPKPLAQFKVDIAREKIIVSQMDLS
ncbi:MAG: Rieske 2Fe-2S domain-containing protein [Candidatus Marinimicrobia bacterium]|jgi:Rieske Fe-S protein|nr:Rieske 2Fe-2S domain-containing protein [Candidatus Neomarinimicrobiota bacterium]MBT3496429.1 Rieske 2Fe-2S domain-containing protein [Candidatus Neomarinimicrobiota bacterium]MBT3691791.1 Rieske 2Fe-2S domain-containing protein [Candidatus Neomarinimicrobiota bacterium]MBT4144701.1 Rieske 2Fe-2S domain-containing protein [Candidatus Neomarinimicrobiota bacterium]MBT4593197.1 Rieske 2Fe-2S domain-containing protein [Candidatus Neomarinimicrobiota bacterium]